MLIRLNGLTKVFQSKQTTISVLKKIDLTIEQGEIFGIIGLSGAGKSTLIRCVNYLEQPTAGEVWFDGMNLSTLPKKQLRQLRQKMGMIFQDFNLFEQRNVLSNVCYPLEIGKMDRNQARKKAKKLLELVEMWGKWDSYPGKLSGGQKQRVAIARALATDPKLLLCDEATSALDPRTTQSILKLLKKINQLMGVTILVVTHEMSVIEQLCDRVAVMDQGNIVELATVEQLFKSPQSEIAKTFILPKPGALVPVGSRRYRIVFDGNASDEPVIAGLVEHCQVMVNICYANTKDVEGKAFGEMLLQFPDNEEAVTRSLKYLKQKGIFFQEEVNQHGC